MLLRHRARQIRQWGRVGFVGLMALLALLPLAAQLAGRNSWRVGENRAQAPLPVMPADIAALRAWPRAADAALADRFGLRTQLVSLHDQALFHLFGTFATKLVEAGPDGRLFLGGDWGRSPTRRVCGHGLPAGQLPQMVAQATRLLRGLQARAPQVDLLVAPSAPVLYPTELPGWLQADCTTGTPMARQVLDLLPPEWRVRSLYPVAQLAEPGLRAPAIPRRFLHWDGVGAGLAASAWAEGHRHLPPLRAVAAAWHRRPSDLGGFFPGVALWSMALEPLAELPGIESCMGWTCFPGFAETARTLVDVRRFSATPPGVGRLLVLSDSFGAAVAPWLARYHGEVWQFTMNYLEQLPLEQRRQFMHAVLEEYRPDQLLLVILDASLAITLPRLLLLVE